MMLYRVDQRVFSVGDRIEPNTSFETELHEEKREMEELLNQTRPKNVPERNQCLFLFHDFICALRFLVNMAVLFTVSVFRIIHPYTLGVI